MHLTTELVSLEIKPEIHTDTVVRVIKGLLNSYRGSAALRLWNDATHPIGQSSPDFTLVVRDPAVIRALVLNRSPILLADAYFHGHLDFEGDLYAVLRLKGHFESLVLSLRERFSLWVDAMRLPRKHQIVSPLTHHAVLKSDESRSHEHSKQSDSAAVSFHYDMSNEFYKLWLDKEMVYSCAYFENEADSLEQAQRNKLDHICHKLRLQPGEKFLDVGCGWGALVCWAASNYGVQAHGITLSQQQHDFAQQRIASEGLGDLVTVELLDYRDLKGKAIYDKVSSVGMFEHVGLSNLAAYNSNVFRVLKPGGLFLNHGITHDEEGWNPTVDSEFINRYVFPGGELDTVSNIQRGMEQAGFEIHDVEALRSHYALTLRHWVKRLEAAHEQALQHVSERIYRVWRLYMAACALEFEAGGTGIYQILSVKRGGALKTLPLTRRDLYKADPATCNQADGRNP